MPFALATLITTVPQTCPTIELSKELLRQKHQNVIVGAPQFKGKDIVLVAGSDGRHPLDVHIKEIKANREDYAVFHGTCMKPFC